MDYNLIYNFFWGIATFMLLGSGIYFSLKFKFIQFKFKKIISSLIPSKNEKKGVTPFETLNMALASRIGVGSLAGVSLAIYYGGMGSIFWMWITAIICSTNALSESMLGVIYRVKDKGYIYKGGPSYYIDRGLNNKLLSKLYAFIVIFAYIVGFLTIQANTIVTSITLVFNIKEIVVGILIILTTLLIIFKGVKGIAITTSKLVPIMSITYILVAFFIIITNIEQVPFIIKSIIDSAFNFRSFSFGFITTLIIGIQRGIFSNEAGIGSGAIASAVSNTNNPVKQGLIQLLGVYFTTLVICTATALVVLLSDFNQLELLDVNGIEITQYAFNYHIGELGNYLIMLSIILFAFSTIITGYFYGESNLKFLFKTISDKFIIVFKFIVIGFLLFGSLTSASVIWNIVDTFVLLMGIINVYALILLRKTIIKYFNYYRCSKL